MIRPHTAQAGLKARFESPGNARDIHEANRLPCLSAENCFLGKRFQLNREADQAANPAFYPDETLTSRARGEIRG